MEPAMREMLERVVTSRDVIGAFMMANTHPKVQPVHVGSKSGSLVEQIGRTKALMHQVGDDLSRQTSEIERLTDSESLKRIQGCQNFEMI